MLRYLTSECLRKEPILAATMLSDRRKQFFDRLKWPVDVDPFGFERDEYDNLDPVYVVLSDSAGSHVGSMRLLPMAGRTMIEEHFYDALRGHEVDRNRTWECTRFCIAPAQKQRMGLALCAAGARFVKELGIERLVAVFDEKMDRLYKLGGVQPEIIGSFRYPFGEVMTGYWKFDENKYRTLLRAASIDSAELEIAIVNSNVKRIRERVGAEFA